MGGNICVGLELVNVEMIVSSGSRRKSQRNSDCIDDASNNEGASIELFLLVSSCVRWKKLLVMFGIKQDLVTNLKLDEWWFRVDLPEEGGQFGCMLV